MASGVDGLAGNEAAEAAAAFLAFGVALCGDVRFRGRPALDFGIGVSGGNIPSSMEIAMALGIESQLFPVGDIHLRRRRFCKIGETV